jgi:hypothetical protein
MDHVDALLPEYLAGDLDPQAKAGWRPTLGPVSGARKSFGA